MPILFQSLADIEQKWTDKIRFDGHFHHICNETDFMLFTLLQELYISNTDFTELPELPDSIEVLDIQKNRNLKHIRKFPKNLKRLFIQKNTNLTSLPPLPNTLERLYCMNNKSLSVLPELPDNLRDLDCCRNALTTVPKLPNTLKFFWCQENQITNLPSLPNGLYLLSCYNNPIKRLPWLPDRLLTITSDIDTNNARTLIDRQRRQHRLMCSKFRQKFNAWLWRVRKRLAEKQYHPDRIKELLDAGIDIEELELYL